jgi:hypothetical protein
MGVWYELAYHDWTQYAICGCTRFNMTQRAHTIEDMFTTKCPKNEPLLGQTYAVNMSMAINPATPGQFLEKAFYTDWPNMVLDVWGKSSSDGARAGGVASGSAGSSSSSSGSGKSYYKKAIQMQCLEVSHSFSGCCSLYVCLLLCAHVSHRGVIALPERYVRPYSGCNAKLAYGISTLAA